MLLWLVHVWNSKGTPFSSSKENAYYSLDFTNLLHLGTAPGFLKVKLARHRKNFLLNLLLEILGVMTRRWKLWAKWLIVIYNLSFCLFTMLKNGVSSFHMSNHWLIWTTNYKIKFIIAQIWLSTSRLIQSLHN